MIQEEARFNQLYLSLGRIHEIGLSAAESESCSLLLDDGLRRSDSTEPCHQA